MASVIFRRTQGGTVTLGQEAWAILNRYRQNDATAPEAGGVLLGRFIKETHDIVVDNVTTPGIGDAASRLTFRRGRRRTQTLIDRAWHESGGARNYLGEWHTHPEDEPSPSGIDLGNWKRIVETARYEQDSLLFVIVGRRHVRIWEVFRASGVVNQLGNGDDTDAT